MGLEEALRLVEQGKVEELSQEVGKLHGDERLEGELWKLVYLDVSETEKNIALVNQILAKSPLSARIQCLALIIRAPLTNPDEWFNSLEQAQKLLDMLPLEEQHDLVHYQMLIWFYKALYHDHQGDFNKALDFLSQCTQMAENNEFPLKSFILSYVVFRLGFNYKLKGDYNRAITYLEQSLTTFRDLGNKPGQIWPLLNLGDIYHLQGDVERAIMYGEDTLELAQKYHSRYAVVLALWHLGETYLSFGNVQKGTNFLQNSLKICQDNLNTHPDFKWAQAWVLYHLCLLQLELGASQQAQEHLSHLKSFDKEKGFIYLSEVQTLGQLAQALFLKTSQRFNDKAQAQMLLRQMVEKTGIREELRFEALQNLCDLVLEELRTLGDDTLFHDVQTLIQQIVDLAQAWEFAPAVAKSLILQGKLLLIEGEAQETMNLLEKAHGIAEEKGLGRLSVKIETELDTLRTELTRWQDAKTAPLQERLKAANLEAYLKRAIKRRDLILEKQT